MLLTMLTLACSGATVDTSPLTTDDTAADDTAADDTGDTGDTAADDTGDTGSATTQGTRGVWAWRDAGDPYGTDAVVGDAAAEDAMIQALIDWDVDRVYGTYGDRAQSEPEVLAAWNAKLHAAGIQSHVLMGDPAWTSADNWGEMRGKIEQRLLEFNAAQPDSNMRYDGLHLDIEPHASAEWDRATPEQKMALVTKLQQTYGHARSTLNDAGQQDLPIGVDMAVWIDNLPADGGQVAWPSESHRDDWYGGLPVQSWTGMAYERDTDTSIVSGIQTEAGLLLEPQLRIGLNEEVGSTWVDIEEMFAMAQTLEAQGYLVDLHSYSKIAGQLGL